MTVETRIPTQKRSIEKRDRIIDAGFKLMTSNGYYNTNTAEIAKEASVSTGIVYQYFKDKHDILLAGMEKYGEEIFFPLIDLDEDTKLPKDNIEDYIKSLINKAVKNHKLSSKAHEEFMSMVHGDVDIANYYHEHELDMSLRITKMLESNGIVKEDLRERVHVIIGIVDNLCHERVYHKHEELDYDLMTDIVVREIINLVK